MRLCGIGFSLCVFPVGGSPGFQSGGARLQACGKSASTRKASAPALRPVAQPFLAVRLWSVGSPLTAFFAPFRFPDSGRNAHRGAVGPSLDDGFHRRSPPPCRNIVSTLVIKQKPERRRGAEACVEFGQRLFASDASNAIIAGMATLTIRQLDQKTKTRLRDRKSTRLNSSHDQ